LFFRQEAARISKGKVNGSRAVVNLVKEAGRD
jgi:hypothetical protein